ncbi:thioesterase II family protein [Streptomyces heilongjiangensis]|uniref:Thioesterase II family protein n=1 Tax=Streptomyces heilongjiangensis TaxID=945052 RepID=A0ABW1B0C6_9ACTN|nr:alpha/beta fold hydrolase [Streptomyces heilongjiangensis]MDC2946533.1 alpha/beta fold hydrolase [Streptomyces heilongjiangensis]
MTVDAPVRPADLWALRMREATARAPLLRLFCVPYAGGGAAVYHGWADRLPGVIEPWAVRMPGRDARLHEPLRTDLVATAEELADALAPLLTQPYAFFGHSLGAFLAFETVRALRERGAPEPALLAVSARNPPQQRTYEGCVHRLPDDEYLDVLDSRYGAIPPMLREDAQMRALYLPILRADTTMLETYRYVPARPLGCPVVAYGGAEDPETSAATLGAWAEVTGAGCATAVLPGGHFFLGSSREELLGLLSAELLRALVP